MMGCIHMQQLASKLPLLLLLAFHVDANNVTDAESVGHKSNAQSAPMSLFNTLLASLIAVLIGFLCVRLQVIVPERGDLRGFGFFIGQIAYPLLVFKTVATAKFGNVDVGTIAACTLGKIIVMLATWTASWFAYRPRRSRGQRVLSATIFAFFVTASNDFALGFPVIDALYGDSFNMRIYITGNALVTAAIFVPLSMIMLSIGSSMVRKEETKDEEVGMEKIQMNPCVQVLIVARDILLNPVIFMTLLALLYQACLSNSLVEDGNGYRFPHPLSDLVDLIAQPFGMCALFLTGTSLQTPRISLLPLFLVAMKVVVCAFATFFLASFLVGSNMGTAAREVLHNFSFLYGMIPASSAPLIFANQFDPSTSEIIATAILLGLVIAGPMMFVASMFLEGGNLDSVAILAFTEYTTVIVSLVCGVLFVALLIVLRSDWGYKCQYKSLLAGYGLVLIVYEALAFAINPNLNKGTCEAILESRWNPFRFALSWLQQSSQFIILLLLIMMARKSVSTNVGLLWALLCLVLGIIPGIILVPNTISQMCAEWSEHSSNIQVLPDLSWSAALCLLMLGLIFYGSIRSTKSQSMNIEAHPSQRSQTSQTSQKSRRSNPSMATSHGQEPEGSPRADAEMGRLDSEVWIGTPPWSVIRSLVALQTMCLFMQVVNSSMVYGNHEVEGGFAEMLVLEILLQHGQLAALLVLLLGDEHFGRHVGRVCRKLAPWLFNSEADQLREMSIGEQFSMVSRLQSTAHVVPPMVVRRLSSTPY